MRTWGKGREGQKGEREGDGQRHGRKEGAKWYNTLTLSWVCMYVGGRSENSPIFGTYTCSIPLKGIYSGGDQIAVGRGVGERGKSRRLAER